MSLNVALVAPEGEIWTGAARQVIAKTLDGDIGILTGHTPVLGILAEGSLVRIFPEDGSGEVAAAIGGGFLSVADDQVSVLARQALLAQDVDRASARTAGSWPLPSSSLTAASWAGSSPAIISAISSGVRSPKRCCARIFAPIPNTFPVCSTISIGTRIHSGRR